MSDEKTAGLKLRRVSAITATLVQICLVQPGPGVVSAQSDMSEWAAFTSMREVNAVLTTATDMWAATSGGLLRYDLVNERYERFTLLDGLASNRVLSIAIDDDNQLWLGTASDGLSRLDLATGASSTSRGTAAARSVTCTFCTAGAAMTAVAAPIHAGARPV